MQDEQRLERRRKRDVDELCVTLALNSRHNTHTIDVSLHDVATQSIAGAQRSFQVDFRSFLPVADGGALERRGDGRRVEPVGAEFTDRQARAIDGDALPSREIVERRADA